MSRFSPSSFLFPSAGWAVADLGPLVRAARAGAVEIYMGVRGSDFSAVVVALFFAVALFGAAPWLPAPVVGALFGLLLAGAYFGPRHPAIIRALGWIGRHKYISVAVLVGLGLCAISSQALAIVPLLIGIGALYFLGQDLQNRVNQMANFSTADFGQGTKFIREHSQDYLFSLLNAMSRVLDVALPVIQPVALSILLGGGIIAAVLWGIKLMAGEGQPPSKYKVLWFIVFSILAASILSSPEKTKSFYMDWFSTPALQLGAGISDKILAGNDDVSGAINSMMSKMGADVAPPTCGGAGMSSYQSAAVALGCSLNSIISVVAFPIALADFANALSDAPDKIFASMAGVEDRSVWPLSSELWSIKIKLMLASWLIYAAGFVVVLSLMLSMLMLLFRVILLGVFFPFCVLGLPFPPFRPALISLIRALVNSAAVLIGWAAVILITFEMFRRGYVDLLAANPAMIPAGVERGRMLDSAGSFAVFVKSICFGPLFFSTIITCVTIYVLQNAASGIATMLVGGSDGLDPARQASSTVVGGLISGATAGATMLAGQAFAKRGGVSLPKPPAPTAPDAGGGEDAPPSPNRRPD